MTAMAMWISGGGLALCLGSMALADYRLDLVGTGLRDYYCTITVTLTNETNAPVTEINGYFLSFVGGKQVGRSKGSSFLNIAPDGTGSTIFETPNAPCDDVTRYEFVVNACRFDSEFAKRTECTMRIDAVAPLTNAEGL
ncbi:MAG: hypothetical protein AAF982_08595 [Pseudomonadota bacterium]